MKHLDMRRRIAHAAARLLAEDGSLRWQGAAGERVWTHEPETGAGLRALVWLLSWLPIESQL